MPDAVSDSSPLIHLAKIEALELISRLYSRILIPPAVWREVVEESDGRPGAVEMERALPVNPSNWLPGAHPNTRDPAWSSLIV